MNPLRKLWAAGGVTYGGWLTIPGSIGAEIAGNCGFDWVCIDTQHGLIGYDAMVPMLQGLTAAGAPAIVRVPWNEPSAIQKTLDAGAHGVIVPMVNTVEEARAAVAACRYVPDGNRSWGPMRTRLVDPTYGVDDSLDVVCVVMCETVQGLENLETILREVPGIDAVYVGPNDLAVSLQVRGSSYAGEHPTHRAAIQRIVATATAAGVVAGIHCGSPEVGEQWRREGFRMLTVGVDAPILESGLRAAAARARELAG